MIGGYADGNGREALAGERFAVLRMGRTALLIAQRQIHALEPALEVRRTGGEAQGWLRVAGTDSPVYCLSEDLQPMCDIPADRSVCVVLNSDDESVGLLCHELSLLEPVQLEFKPLPPCMRASHTPVKGLVVHGEQVLCISTAQDLLNCVNEGAAAGGDIRHASATSRDKI